MIVQATPAIELATVATNWLVPDGPNGTDTGATETDMGAAGADGGGDDGGGAGAGAGGCRLTVACTDFPGSPTLAAVTVTV